MKPKQIHYLFRQVGTDNEALISVFSGRLFSLINYYDVKDQYFFQVFLILYQILKHFTSFFYKNFIPDEKKLKKQFIVNLDFKN